MRKFILVCLLAVCFVFCSINASANPFLVCDPQTDVTHYSVTVDGIENIVEAYDLGNGTVKLRYDCGNFTAGAHNIVVKAINLWGESAEVPFDCVKVLPGVPSGIGLEAN